MGRGGFTLFEMVNVLLIVVVAASLIVPFVDSLMHPSQVTASIDMVRINCERARSRAMEEGRPYRFSIVEGGDALHVEPDDADVNPEPGLMIDDNLPDGCLFVSNDPGLIAAGATASKGGSGRRRSCFCPTARPATTWT